MYSNILIPVIPDEDAGAPLPSLAVAHGLADAGAKITLIHVVEELPSYASAYVPDEFTERTRGEIKAQLERMAGTEAGVTAEVVRGHAANSILEWAKEYGCDCIVIASHKPGLSDYFLGSTAARVVRHAQCAVHVLR